MAKTQKRQIQRPVRTLTTESAPVVRTAVPLKSAQADFNPDYTLIKQDLKRIAILAVTFITTLVVLAFFLR